MTVKEALAEAKEELKNVPDRDVDAAWIVCAVTGIKRNMLRFDGDKSLDAKQEKALREILSRRSKREPLQYIFGFVPFYEITLKCDRRALIPRDETALLAEKAIEIIREKNYNTVLDIGTGTGAIALSCAHALHGISVTAADISDDALSLARENAEMLSLNVEFVESDLFSALENRKFDCILSNPPYIPTKDIEKLERELSFEPFNALDGGGDGLDFYRDIIAEATDRLNENGLLMFEVGFDQADAVKAIMAKHGFTEVFILNDYSDIPRIVYAFKE